MYIIFSWSVHPLMDISVVSIPWLSWIMLRWTQQCTCLFEIMISFTWNMYPEVELPDHVVVLLLIFFFFLRNLHAVFHSGCISLHFQPQCTGFRFLYILTSVCDPLSFSITEILTGVKWYLIVVLICIYPLIIDGEHLFMYLLPICISSLEKCLFRSFVHFVIEL